MFTIYSLVAGIILTLSLSPSVIVCSLRAFHIELVSLCHFLKSVVVGIGYSQDPASSVLHTGDQVPLFQTVVTSGELVGLYSWFGAASDIGLVLWGGFSCCGWHWLNLCGRLQLSSVAFVNSHWTKTTHRIGGPGPSLPYPSNLCLSSGSRVAPSWSLSC